MKLVRRLTWRERGGREKIKGEGPRYKWSFSIAIRDLGGPSGSFEASEGPKWSETGEGGSNI
jgi:hypothetical protein